MRKFLMVCFMIAALAGVAAPSRALRGIWVQEWQIRSPSFVETAFDRAKSVGVDTIYLCVFSQEQAYWKSDLAPRAPLVTMDFDPLAYCIEAAHKRGMTLHAWFMNGAAGGTSGGKRGGILAKHPEWAAKIIGKNPLPWLDLARPEVRRFEVALMLEAARMYPTLDGLHFDYIRYPPYAGCYCDRCLGEFQRETGIPRDALMKDIETKAKTDATAKWLQWRKDRISELVREVYAQAKKLRPNLTVSAAVWGLHSSADAVCQDWTAWTAEPIIDYVIPMAYGDDTLVNTCIADWKAHPRWSWKVIPGIALRRASTTRPGVGGPGQAARQIALSQEERFGGVVMFSISGLSDAMIERIGEEKQR